MYENLKVVSFFDKKKFLLFCRRERATKYKTVAELSITRRNIRVRLKAAGFSVVLDAASIQSSVKTPRDHSSDTTVSREKPPQKYCQNEK